ncbi:hypothetical protein VSH64_40550 [Amycolatopsis rhabdoformis]|uniref:Uncharacterized protein n=1 Tax=Amycolatopsis rhabdoformis TaxID=1448059 RepID=A0ABZ1I502_9PSEU|nr:hypothetical protein [Amycolatopsis rhabdoformis]WSE29046.1 hypothetical protein VSH64_40550 [Amycolatopsis rhabdoformis]
MCRSSAGGGRRCTGGASRSRAHAAIRQRVSRARRAVADATAAGDSDAVTSANTRLAEAKEALTAHNTAHQAEQETRMDTPEQPTPQPPTANTAGQTGDVTPAKATPSTPNTPPAPKTPKRKAKQATSRRQPRKGSGTRRRRSQSDVVVHPRSTNPPATTEPNAHRSEQYEFRALWQSFKAPEARAAKASTPDAPPPAPENRQAPHGEPHSDTSAQDPHEQATSDQPRVTDYTAPDGTRFTNYAAPGATVGAQIGVMHGPTTFTSGSDFDPFRGPGSNTTTSGSDFDPFRGPGSNTTTSDPRPERERPTGDSRTTASGNDYVEQQIGIQYGPTFHGKSSQ